MRKLKRYVKVFKYIRDYCNFVGVKILFQFLLRKYLDTNPTPPKTLYYEISGSVASFIGTRVSVIRMLVKIP